MAANKLPSTHSANNNKAALLIVWHDITLQKQAVEKLKSSEALLRDTQQLTHSGSWEMDMLTGKNYWSAEAFRIFGLEPKGHGPGTEEFDKMIHPDDREKYLDSIRSALKVAKHLISIYVSLGQTAR